MPVRTVFRHPETGRFISASAAAELDEVRRLTIGPSGVTEEPYSFFDDEEPEYDPYPLSDSKWGARIMDDTGDGLDLDRLVSMDFPAGTDAFRVTFYGVNRYRKEKNAEGYMNSSWFGPGDWPPDESWLDDNNAEGIAHIVFRRAH